MSKTLLGSPKQFICGNLKSSVTIKQEALQMQRDRVTCHQYKISLLKRLAIRGMTFKDT